MLADSHDEFYDPEKVDPSQEGHSGDVDADIVTQVKKKLILGRVVVSYPWWTVDGFEGRRTDWFL